MMLEEAKEIAHTILMSEFEEIKRDPVSYMESVGLDADQFHVNWNDLSWTEENTEQLAFAILNGVMLSRECDPAEASLDALQSDIVDDTLNDIIFQTITRESPVAFT